MLILGLMPLRVRGQSQVCPVNIDFSSGDLAAWSALTGLLGRDVVTNYNSNAGVTIIPEYTISATGIQVISSPGIDPFGGFPTIPVINGYAYKNVVKLGSTATSYDLRAPGVSNPGGFRRSISYVIQVPAGPANVPYTMTYAYAMVLENGTHNSNEQPMFKATLTTSEGVIDCASPQYYLPTLNDAGHGGNPGGPGGGSSTGATLDSAAALAAGFTVSPRPFLSHAGAAGNGGTLLYDVWTKGWTEVTFDLSPYRGQSVTLNFEADNCLPGAHFAYAYVALRGSCGGLTISGPARACLNTPATYSVPALAEATYTWTVPAGWTVDSGAGGHMIVVTPGTSAGNISVHEVNSCADLRATMAVSASPPTIAGRLAGSATVCQGASSVPIKLEGQRGDVVGWYASEGGGAWASLNNTTTQYTASNLDTTTTYYALVRNGDACSIDTAQPATVTVDPRSLGGALSPIEITVCQGQDQGSLLTLQGQRGSVLKWEKSLDSATWSGFSPPAPATSYQVGTITKSTYYRAIVKSGVCPQDTSQVAATLFEPSPYPQFSLSPLSASLCYGDSVDLGVDVTQGTDYSWTPDSSLSGVAAGAVGPLPQTIHVMATPPDSTYYVLSVRNEGCPNTRTDSVPVGVTPPVIVSAGNDTAIVAGQLLQLHATVNNPSADLFTWEPPTGLNATHIASPVAMLSATTDTITYVVEAADPIGCFGVDSIQVAVFKTGADIFVPTAFTPNGDGMNDLLKPICVGIRQMAYFRVYNRWGQLVFTTSRMDAGWDGRVNGTAQPTGGYVFMAEGTDFNGKTVYRKGTSILIR